MVIEKIGSHGNVNFSFKDISGSALCTVLDINGICASSGSACNSAQNKPSHVLQAMKVNPDYIYYIATLTLSPPYLYIFLYSLLYNLHPLTYYIFQNLV